MSRLTYDKVTIISGRFGLQSLQDFRIEVKANQHGAMWFSGIVHMESGFTEIEDQILNTVVTAAELDGAGEIARNIFSGIIQDVHISFDSGLYQIRVKAVSGTYLLDMNTKSRSFQDVTMTYAEVVKLVLKDTPDAAAIFTVGLDTPIGVPLIQYKETDWAFIRRIASHFNALLIPETLSYKPHFWFGMRKGKENRTFDEDEYKVVIDEDYYAMGGGSMGWRRRDFFYYELESDKAYEIGDKSVYKQKELKICEKKAEFRHGELYFHYRLGLESLVYEKTYFNEKICGLSLIGTVLETDREVVKMHLDIDGDKNWEAGTAYPYKWVPTTGNLMYLMPKVGTRVSLYMCDHDERSAVSINCVRTNGGSNPDMGDYNKRYLTTEHQKRMYLFPESMGLVGTSGSSTALTIKMEDASGILAQSHNKIMITASDSVSMNASEFNMNCPAQITLKQGGTSLVINNQFDVKGAKGHLTGSGASGGKPETKKKQEKLTEESNFDWCEQAGAVIGCMVCASSPSAGESVMKEVCGAGDVGAGSVLAAASVGTARIKTETVQEASNEKMSNPGKSMAAGASGGALVSATGGAPSKNPAAAPGDGGVLIDRITEIKGTTTYVQRDTIVPKAVQMSRPFLPNEIFRNDSAQYEAASLFAGTSLPDPEPIEQLRIGDSIGPLKGQSLRSAANQFAKSLESMGYQTQMHTSYLSRDETHIITTNSSPAKKIQRVILTKREDGGQWLSSAVVMTKDNRSFRMENGRMTEIYRKATHRRDENEN